MTALRIESTDALLHASIEVDERAADTTAMVETELRFADAIAAQFELAVFDEVVAAQVRQPGTEGSLAHRVAMDHALRAQLMVFAVAGLLEVVAVGGDLRTVFALTVGVTERPPAPRQAVIEHGVVGSVLVIGHRIVTAAQAQLVGEAQRAVPVERGTPLLLAGAALAVIAARQAGAPWLLRRIGDPHFTAADILPRRQLHFCLIGWQAIELIDHLLDLAQVDQFTAFAGKGHGQFAIREPAVFRAFHAFEFAFDHQHFQVPGGQILLWQVCAAGDQTFFDVVIGDDFEQLVELRHAEAFADIGFEQTRLFALRQAVGALEFDVFDGETATIGGGRRLRWSGVFAGQVLEFFETSLLLFEQTVLTFTDQVGFTGGGRSPGRFKRRKAEQSQTQPRREGGWKHLRSLDRKSDIKIVARY